MRDYKTTKANKKDSGKMSREEYLYHNTEVLLKKYRDVVWSIEVSAMQAQISFELEMDCKLEEFLEMSYAAGADLSGTNIQEQMRTLERNKKMLKIIERAIKIMRERHADGEEYYWLLYYTYLSEKPCKNIDAIIELICDDLKYQDKQNDPQYLMLNTKLREDKRINKIKKNNNSNSNLP